MEWAEIAAADTPLEMFDILARGDATAEQQRLLLGSLIGPDELRATEDGELLRKLADKLGIGYVEAV
jgi:hypothetical protein